MDARRDEKSIVFTTHKEPSLTQRLHQRYDVQWTMFNAIGREKKQKEKDGEGRERKK